MKFLFAVLFIVVVIVVSAFAMEHEPPGINTRAALGKKLFNDKILSLDSSVSCSGCHKPEFAFADTAAFSKGIGGKLTTRNVPSVLNMKNRPYYFWDGRAASLDIQALMPIENPDEMGLPADEAVKRLNASKEYRTLFLKIFRQAPNTTNLAAALSAYERTLETVDSRFDDWSNSLGRLSPAEERGRQLFIGPKAKCFDCHAQEDFTTDEFRNIGLYDDWKLTDAGLFNITGKAEDKGKFKIPGLRNVGVTAPYMHNGMFRTLEQVIDYYNDPSAFVMDPVNIDPLLRKPLGLSDREKKDLVAFLKSLTDKKYIRAKK